MTSWRKAGLAIARRLPGIGPLIAQGEAARRVVQWVPPGHFHSPIPDMDEVRRDAPRIFGEPRGELPGIDLNEQAQLTALRAIADFYPELPFAPAAQAGLRYYFDNPTYSYSDAIFFYGILRHVRPRRVIEVGSGFSSALLLDVNQRFFDNTITCTFIDPYPQRLLALMTEADHKRVEVVSARLQDVDVKRFGDLEANDILFIDSSHVLKIGSDVLQIIVEVLPALRRGVYVHFHDIFFPFEYPRPWVEEGRYWTEAYALRAFLEFNAAFEIVLFNTYLAMQHRSLLESLMPLCFRNTGGSIWLRRVA